MPSLIAAFRNGKRIGGCDANCYDARAIGAEQCSCICGGANHGVGLRKAYENTLALKGDWKERYRKTRKGPITFETIDQLEIFW